LSPNIEEEDNDAEPEIPPPIPMPAFLIILLLIYRRLSKLNTTIIATNDMGNGSNIMTQAQGQAFTNVKTIIK
jgi:hypothetical protein